MIDMNKKKIDELIVEIQGKEKELISEKKDIVIKDEAMKKELKRVVGPMQTVIGQIDSIKGVIVATGEKNPQDLKLAEDRREKLESMQRVATETLNKNHKRSVEIEKELADHDRAKRALEVFTNGREFNELVIKGMFKPLTENERLRLKKLVRWDGLGDNVGEKNYGTNKVLLKRTAMGLVTEKPFIKFY